MIEEFDPEDLFTGSTTSIHTLKHIHVFECSAYVLDPVLQTGNKLLRCKPRSHRGVFGGFRTRHSSDGTLILNLQTRIISPQYHVIFDNIFTTAEFIIEDKDPPIFWNNIDLEAKRL